MTEALIEMTQERENRPEPKREAKKDWLALVHELGPQFAESAVHHDDTDSFVMENFLSLKENKFFSAAVPMELGGGRRVI